MTADDPGNGILVLVEQECPQLLSCPLGEEIPALAERYPGGLDRRILVWVHDPARASHEDRHGVADRTGSITPGKKADLVIIDTKAVNVAPVIDPVGAVVCAADISNVKTVLVDGRVVKEDFRLVADLDGPRRLVEASRDHLVEEFGEPEPGWLTAEMAAR